ncbi:MAG: PucR family transcriptional regulator [Pseudomonadota bacterium]
MTNVITRYFDSASQALATRRTLQLRGFPLRDLAVFTDAQDLAETLVAEKVEAATAKAYAERLADGGAVFLAKATYKPLGAARLTRELTAQMGAADMGGLTEEVYYKPKPTAPSSIYRDHSRYLTRKKDPTSTDFHMADWPIPLINRRKPMDDTLFPRHARMASWPIGLLVPNHDRMADKPIDHLVPGHKHMARFPFGHIVPGHRYMAKFPFAHIVPGHKHMAKFPFGHIVPGHKHMAKFPIAHLVPKGMRMARWPFPLLINDKTGTNALMPGGPRMAGFPIGHLVPGQKYMAKIPFAHIVPGHRYMAKFPFAHIVPGHKFMAKYPIGHLVPKGKRMANLILPLLVKHGASKSTPAGKGFSFSKMVGLPTLWAR